MEVRLLGVCPWKCYNCGVDIVNMANGSAATWSMADRNVTSGSLDIGSADIGGVATGNVAFESLPSLVNEPFERQ